MYKLLRTAFRLLLLFGFWFLFLFGFRFQSSENWWGPIWKSQWGNRPCRLYWHARGVFTVQWNRSMVHCNWPFEGSTHYMAAWGVLYLAWGFSALVFLAQTCCFLCRFVFRVRLESLNSAVGALVRNPCIAIVLLFPKIIGISGFPCTLSASYCQSILPRSALTNSILFAGKYGMYVKVQSFRVLLNRFALWFKYARWV